MHRAFRLILLAWIGLAGLGLEARSQETVPSPAGNSRESATTIGIPPDQLAAITEALKREQKLSEEQQQMIDNLAGKLGISAEALRGFFRTFDKVHEALGLPPLSEMPAEQQEGQLVAFAQRLAEVAADPRDDPETAKLKSEEKAALEAGELERANDLYAARTARVSSEGITQAKVLIRRAPAEVTASRIFAGPTEYPPKEFAAYGILAFRSRPSPHDRDRHMMFCDAYVATLPSASELEVPRSKQMVTVWPVNSDEYSNRLNQLVDYSRDICQIAVDHYDLVIAQQAIKDAELTAKNLTGSGPFLLAWSPATDKGMEGVLVLVSDLSDITTYEQARERLEAWSRDIERDPTLWTKGWNLERLRIAIRDWVDKYGARSLSVFGIKG